MKKYVLPIVVCTIIFCAISIFIINQRNQELEKLNSEMMLTFTKTKNIIPSFLNAFDNLILYANLRVPNVDLRDTDGNLTKISEIVEVEKMIIFLPKVDCHTCSARELEVLKSFISPKERERIHVIAKFQNERELKLFEKNAGIKTYSIQSNVNLFSNKTLNESPVMFILSPYLSAYCFFLDNKGSHKLSQEYYKMIQKRFEI